MYKKSKYFIYTCSLVSTFSLSVALLRLLEYSMVPIKFKTLTICLNLFKQAAIEINKSETVCCFLGLNP